MSLPVQAVAAVRKERTEEPYWLQRRRARPVGALSWEEMMEEVQTAFAQQQEQRGKRAAYAYVPNLTVPNGGGPTIEEVD